VLSLGPTTVLVGLVWAILQPYRVTLLHPGGQGFWWYAVEPPVLVILAGLLFHYAVARGVAADLEAAQGERPASAAEPEAAPAAVGRLGCG
jgi:hypothetical protein